MKTFVEYFKHIVAGLILSATFSCSNDFLNENISSSAPYDVSGGIYISPEWEASSYPISCRGAGNAKFSISNIPEWLNIASKSGQFVNDEVYITCSASVYSKFSETGFYSASMTMDVEDVGKYIIPVFYINEGTPDIVATDNFEFGLSNYYEQVLNISNKGDGILVWNITECPRWIRIDISTNILLPYEGTSISIAVNEDELFLKDITPETIINEFTGQIVVASNDKNKPTTVIKVTLNTGDPSVYYYSDVVDFERTETEKTFSFSNYGNGILSWRIEDCPEWISFSQTQGVGSADLQVTCDRSNLPAGANSAIFTVRTNDPQNPVQHITVKCRNGSANSDNVAGITGTVTDAQFDKLADRLYLSTRHPNRLMIYDAKNRTALHEISLPNAPTCFSISGDGRKIAVGHEGKISLINMSSLQVERVMEVDNIVYDIEWGDGDWCCYTPGTVVQHCNLNWINLVSGERDESPDNMSTSLYGGSIIKKIPNQDYIVATRLHLSPSGIIVFNSQTREYVNYFHESIDQFWFSADGTYLFDSYNNIYKTSAMPAQTEITPVAQLKLEQHIYAKWIDHNPATKSLWVLRNNYFYDNEFKVWQLETDDYTIVNTFIYDEYYLTTIDGEHKEYPVTAHYVFANSDDTEIIVIKNILDRSDGWSMEYIAGKKD
jgi:hypothetical protein